jgi:transposase
MIAISAHTRIWVAREPADFRCGIDGLAKICRTLLQSDPFGGALFVFRNRRSKSIKILNYDGRGFWLCQRRLSKGRFRWWPESDQASLTLEAHQLQLLLAGGDPAVAKGVAVWRPVQEKV